MTKEEIKQDILKALEGLKVSEAQELLQSMKVNLGDNVIIKAPVVKEVSTESKTKPFFETLIILNKEISIFLNNIELDKFTCKISDLRQLKVAHEVALNIIKEIDEIKQYNLNK